MKRTPSRDPARGRAAPTRRALTAEIERVLRLHRFDHHPLRSPLVRHDIADECAGVVSVLFAGTPHSTASRDRSALRTPHSNGGAR
jgi:hypothetical protein